jgi:hypothetical protein
MLVAGFWLSLRILLPDTLGKSLSRQQTPGFAKTHVRTETLAHS